MEEKVIVIGGNHHNTLGLIRSLGKKGIKTVLILCSKKNDSYVLKSRYILDHYLVHNYQDSIAILTDELVCDEKQVVICATDGAASVIDQHRDELKSHYVLPGIQQQGGLNKIMDKEAMSQIAQSCGLRIPYSIVVRKTETDFSNIPFPCIIKPIKSIEGSKADISVCYDAEVFRKKLRNCHSKSVQVQQYISKVFEYQLIGLSFGEVIIPGRSRIITQPLATNTGYLHYEHLDGTEPLEQCKEFMLKTGYSGLFSMEFIRDAEGNDYFMETNFRNDGNSICVTEAGVNLPYIWYSLCKNPNLSLESFETEIKEIYVMPEFDEIRLWSANKISFSRLWKEMKQANAFMEYDPEDPAPTNGKIEFWKRLLITAFIKRPGRTILGRNKD